MTEKNENSSFEDDGIANLRLVGGRPSSSSSSSSSRHHHFEDTYTLVKELQCGSYGTVYVGLHNVRNREYAVKVIDRRYDTRRVSSSRSGRSYYYCPMSMSKSVYSQSLSLLFVVVIVPIRQCLIAVYIYCVHFISPDPIPKYRAQLAHFFI
jgi:serine/threonine protein kinase